MENLERKSFAGKQLTIQLALLCVNQVYGVNTGRKSDTRKSTAILFDTTWKTDGLLPPAAYTSEKEDDRAGVFYNVFKLRKWGGKKIARARLTMFNLSTSRHISENVIHDSGASIEMQQLI